MSAHERVAYVTRQPSSETGIYLSRHEHQWLEIGAERWPAGTWHPVFQCLRCGDVICDLKCTIEDPWASADSVTSGINGRCDRACKPGHTHERDCVNYFDLSGGPSEANVG